MAYTHKPNSGSSFKNSKKTEDKHPDYTGSALIDGVEYYVDTWIQNNPRKPGYDPEKKTSLSHRFKPKGERKGEAPKQQERVTERAPMLPPPSVAEKPEEDLDNLPDIDF